MEDMEKMMIENALSKHEGNYSAAAAQLGITRQTLYNKGRKYGV
jgi:transcriptional regulator with PAS, ATPase and Fis domain